jgi:hypothetical protein
MYIHIYLYRVAVEMVVSSSIVRSLNLDVVSRFFRIINQLWHVYIHTGIYINTHISIYRVAVDMVVSSSIVRSLNLHIY